MTTPSPRLAICATMFELLALIDSKTGNRGFEAFDEPRCGWVTVRAVA